MEGKAIKEMKKGVPALIIVSICSLEVRSMRATFHCFELRPT